MGMPKHLDNETIPQAARKRNENLTIRLNCTFPYMDHAPSAMMHRSRTMTHKDYNGNWLKVVHGRKGFKKEVVGDGCTYVWEGILTITVRKT